VNLATHVASGVANFIGIESLIGTGAADLLTGDNVPSNWNISAANAGNIGGVGMLDFLSFENLTGGTAADTFVFADGMGVTGTINGSGGVDTFDYTAYTSAVTVNLESQTATGTGGFVAVERFIGGTVNDTLIARDLANTWTLSGANAGDINGATTFNSFENLTGGLLADSYRLTPAGSVAGTINGMLGADTLDYGSRATAVSVNLQTGLATSVGSFIAIEALIGSSASDTLTARNIANAWHITANNAGDIGAPGTLAFSSFENLTGGTSVDTFHFQPSSAMSGHLDGGFGNDELNYAALLTSVTANLTTAVAHGVGGLITSVENLTGGSGDDFLLGQAGLNIIAGGPGNDVIVGNFGGDFLSGIGGGGADNMNGGTGEDILIGGSTSWDASIPDLTNIMARWLAVTAYNVRITDLKTNVPQLLPATTVFNDAAGDNDSMLGGGDLDWFITNAGDAIGDLNTPPGETNDVF
jgi:hypothetical protein